MNDNVKTAVFIFIQLDKMVSSARAFQWILLSSGLTAANRRAPVLQGYYKQKGQIVNLSGI